MESQRAGELGYHACKAGINIALFPMQVLLESVILVIILGHSVPGRSK